MEKKCRFCHREFSKKEHVERHERSHTKERPFRCAICGGKYVRRDTLERHMRKHSDRLASTCETNHSESMSEITFVPSLSSQSQSDLAEHLQQHTSPPQRLQPYESLNSGVSSSSFPTLSQKPANSQLYTHVYTGMPPFSETARAGPLLDNECTPALDIEALNLFLSDGNFDALLSSTAPANVYRTEATEQSHIHAHAVSENIRKAWFTNLQKTQEQSSLEHSPRHTNQGSSFTVIDDEYRRTLSLRLQTKAPLTEVLPSADFLVHVTSACVGLYANVMD